MTLLIVFFASFYLDFRRIHYPIDNTVNDENVVLKLENKQYLSRLAYILTQNDYSQNNLKSPSFKKI